MLSRIIRLSLSESFCDTWKHRKSGLYSNTSETKQKTDMYIKRFEYYQYPNFISGKFTPFFSWAERYPYQ